MRVREPRTAFMTKNRGRKEEDECCDADEHDRVIEVQLGGTVLTEVEPDKDPKKHEKEAGKNCQSPPIKIVTGVKLKDEDIVDLVHSPDPAVDAEPRKQQQHQEVATVSLHEIARPKPHLRILIEQELSAVYQALNGENGPCANEESVLERTSTFVASPFAEASEFPNSKLMISTLKIACVKIFHSLDMTIESIAVDEPGLVDPVIHEAIWRSSIRSFIELLVELTESGPV